MTFIQIDLGDRAYDAIKALADALGGKTGAHVITPAITPAITPVINPTPAVAPMTPPPTADMPTTTASPPATTAPAATPAANPAPAAPTAAAPAYTRDQLALASSQLMDAGKMDQLSALLQSFGVASLMTLPPESYGEFATAIRALGAKL